MVPLAAASAFVITGTSLDGSRIAVNFLTFGSDGLVGKSYAGNPEREYQGEQSNTLHVVSSRVKARATCNGWTSHVPRLFPAQLRMHLTVYVSVYVR